MDERHTSVWQLSNHAAERHSNFLLLTNLHRIILWEDGFKRRPGADDLMTRRKCTCFFSCVQMRGQMKAEADLRSECGSSLETPTSTGRSNKSNH